MRFLFNRFAVVDDRCGVKEKRVVDLRKINEFCERRRGYIANIDKYYFGIPLRKKRRNTASERIAENNYLTLSFGRRVFDGDYRTGAAEKHLVRVASRSRIKVVNRNLRRGFGIIYFQSAYNGIVDIF